MRHVVGRITLLGFLAAAGASACVGDTPVTTPAVDAAAAPDTGSPVDAAADAVSGCDAGTASCGGACVPLATSPLHCGRCNHDCGTGAACTAGVCQPVEITSAAADAVALATEARPDNPTTVSTHVFWAVSKNAPGVYQDNVNGGNKITLSTGAAGAAGQSDVAVLGAAVYWPAYSVVTGMVSVFRGNVNSAATQALVGSLGVSAPYGIIVDPAGTKLFGAYTQSSNFGIYKCSLPNGPTCTSAISFAGKSSLNLATDGVSVFVAEQNQGTITALAISTSNTTTVATGQATPNLLRVDGTHLYWSNSGTKTLWRSDLSGANKQQIVSTTAPADGLAADAINVYWTDSAAGTLSYAPIGGGGTTTAYVTQGASASPMRLVRDSQSLFWIKGSSIYRVTLP